MSRWRQQETQAAVPGWERDDGVVLYPMWSVSWELAGWHTYDCSWWFRGTIEEATAAYDAAHPSEVAA